MSEPPHDAAHAGEVPCVLPEYGNDTGFAGDATEGPADEDDRPAEDTDVRPD
jgi:hypothetical protein